jgi:hypothetical protein
MGSKYKAFTCIDREKEWVGGREEVRERERERGREGGRHTRRHTRETEAHSYRIPFTGPGICDSYNQLFWVYPNRL